MNGFFDEFSRFFIVYIWKLVLINICFDSIVNFVSFFLYYLLKKYGALLKKFIRGTFLYARKANKPPQGVSSPDGRGGGGGGGLLPY